LRAAVQQPARAFQSAADGGVDLGHRVGEFSGPLQPRLRDRVGGLFGGCGLPRRCRGANGLAVVTPEVWPTAPFAATVSLIAVKRCRQTLNCSAAPDWGMIPASHGR